MPYIGFHDIIIVLLAMSIILFCKFVLPTVIVQRASKSVCKGRRMFEGKKCPTGRERHVEY